MARDASADEVKKAYRRLALQLHPDKRGGDADAAAAFQRLAFAYNVLSDANKRRYYDETGARATQQRQRRPARSANATGAEARKAQLPLPAATLAAQRHTSPLHVFRRRRRHGGD